MKIGIVLLSAIETNGAAFVQDQLSAEVSGCWLSGETPFSLTPLALNDTQTKRNILWPLRLVIFCIYLVYFCTFEEDRISFPVLTKQVNM